MTGVTSSRPGLPPPIEMTSTPVFLRRIRRLIVVSIIALGLISLLAAAADVGWVAVGLMIGGWVTMPTLLARSLTRPRCRYLLVAPAAMVSAGLLTVAFGFDGSASAGLGWWLMSAGVLTGATLGAWFWYRWAPVPRALHEPFSSARWTLIAIHAGLIAIGGILVVLGEFA